MFVASNLLDLTSNYKVRHEVGVLSPNAFSLELQRVGQRFGEALVERSAGDRLILRTWKFQVYSILIM